MNIKMLLFKIIALFFLFKKKENVPLDHILGWKSWVEDYTNKGMPIILTKDYVVIYGGRRLLNNKVRCIVTNFNYSKQR